MKVISLVFITFFLILTIRTSAQSNNEILNILKFSEDYTDLQNKISHSKNWTAELFSIHSDNNPSAFDKKLLNHKAGDIIESDNHKAFYKIQEVDSSSSLRVSYIYFDGSSLTFDEIEKKRNEILEKLTKGEPFSKLAKKYSMDGSSEKGGDFGWVNQNTLNKIFVSEIAHHKKGEVFKVDIPKYGWYYVVQKTYDTKVTKTSTIILVKKV